MSQKERDRLQGLHEVHQRHIRQKEAAGQMGVSERWVRKLLARMRKEGDRAVIHRLRGRPSNRKIPEPVREKAVSLVRKEYRDFGPTLASEYRAERHGVRVSRETLRGWMLQAQLWTPRRTRIERVHTGRPRRAQCSELVQGDTSEHEWLAGRGEKLSLIALIDAATSRAVARLVPHDSTPENRRLLGIYLRRWGRPLAFYTDKASLFKTTRPQQRDEQLQGQLPRTQIGRALGTWEYGVDLPSEQAAKIYLDAKAAINFLASQPQVDPQRIGMVAATATNNHAARAAMGDARIKTFVGLSFYAPRT